jgi:quinol monooxygenase YgiN
MVRSRKEAPMYGTVARCEVKKENRQALRELSARQMAAREVAGYVTSYVLFEDNDDVAWLVAVFQDRKSYVANANDPAQDADYREFRALMESDPEWHDGEIEQM